MSLLYGPGSPHNVERSSDITKTSPHAVFKSLMPWRFQGLPTIQSAGYIIGFLDEGGDQVRVTGWTDLPHVLTHLDSGMKQRLMAVMPGGDNDISEIRKRFLPPKPEKTEKARKKAKTTTARKPSVLSTSTAVCRDCGNLFEYERRRGRPPVRCDGCKGAASVAVLMEDAAQPKQEVRPLSAFDLYKSPELLEYLEDLKIVHWELNQEALANWTPELLEEAGEAWALRDADVVMLVEFDGAEEVEAVVQHAPFNMTLMSGGFLWHRGKPVTNMKLLGATTVSGRDERDDLEEELLDLDFEDIWIEEVPGAIHRPKAQERLGPVPPLVREWFDYYVNLFSSEPECGIPECSAWLKREDEYCTQHSYQLKDVALQRKYPPLDPRKKMHVFLLWDWDKDGYKECGVSYPEAETGQQRRCEETALSKDGLCRSHKLESLNGFDFSDVRYKPPPPVDWSKVKMCQLPGCDWPAKPAKEEGSFHDYCSPHVSQIKRANRLSDGDQSLHVYLLRPSDHLEKVFRHPRCQAIYEWNGHTVSCPSGEWSRDGLCSDHKLQSLQGLPFSQPLK